MFGKVTIGVLSFVAGALVGAYVVREYVKSHPLELLAPGAAEQLVAKLVGPGKLSSAAGGLVDGLISPSGGN